MKQLLMVFVAVMLLLAGSLFSKEASKYTKLHNSISGTTWQWSGASGELIEFRKNGSIGNTGWEARGLETAWKVIDEHTVLLIITKGRAVDMYAILLFNNDITEYSGYNFSGAGNVSVSKKVR